jgi:hypothetical protein
VILSLPPQVPSASSHQATLLETEGQNIFTPKASLLPFFKSMCKARGFSTNETSHPMAFSAQKPSSKSLLCSKDRLNRPKNGSGEGKVKRTKRQ